jgi:hypothetical protein
MMTTTPERLAELRDIVKDMGEVWATNAFYSHVPETAADLLSVLDDYASAVAERDLFSRYCAEFKARAEALKESATALYVAGVWTTTGVPGDQQAKMWERLRDAIGLPVGTATKAGVAALDEHAALKDALGQHKGALETTLASYQALREENAALKAEVDTWREKKGA